MVRIVLTCGCLFIVAVIVFLWEFDRPFTYISGVTYFPSNATSENALYAIAITVDGERGKAYADMGDKQVFITIDHQRVPILTTKFAVRAGDLKWKVDWKELSSVKVELSDAGDGDWSKIFRTITFKIDPSTNQVFESK